MLNISENSIMPQLDLDRFSAFKLLRKSKFHRFPVYLGIVLFVGFLGSLFLPWTQNIQAKGYVTTRAPEQRPQAIQSVISGKLEKWYVQEGDFVKAGDTIVYISEVKSEYFDPELVERTAEQVSAKSQSITSYEDKMNALENQFRALEEGRLLKQQQIENKIEQARNKIRIDSIDLIAYRANLEIALNQVARTQELYDKGLKSLSELQEKQLKIQEVQAKVTVQENKLLNQKNEFLNLKIQLSSVGREYADKLAKSRSERQSAMSGKFEAVAETSKLRNKLSNYSLRQAFYFITAPQSGYITKTIQKGVGEIVKEGTDIATIMPDVYDLAVEVYVKPQDLPLLKQGEGVRLRFDGWPAIVISGWPEASTGIFDGEISAIDQFISDNGYYRILIVPDNHRKIWPEQLRFGTGANTFILLNDVPLWYEVWRQLNGFPPDFYGADDKENEVKLKAPLKSVK
jgi:adhesin transport system membrane fusion protein